MREIAMTRIKGTSYLLGIAALSATVGCGANTTGSAMQPVVPGAAPAQSMTTQQTGSPVVVSCEPNQRTLVRPVVVNGATLSQIECVTNPGATTVAQPIAAPVYAVAPAPVYQQVRATQPVAVSSDLGDTRIISEPAPATVVRPVETRRVVYQEPIRKKRSVKKSAVIIGSSAGVGAGVGAAVGGKKGALLGALIGGGGATVWDQITRRK
jgi:hypothetical protein